MINSDTSSVTSTLIVSGFPVLSEARRIQILDLLGKKKLGVCDLGEGRWRYSSEAVFSSQGVETDKIKQTNEGH
jgi:DNA-binding transcriptional ArsR family regulator